MVMGFILPMVRDLDGKRRYVHVEKKKKLRNLKAVVRVHFMRSCRKAAARMLCSTATKKRRGWGELVCVSVSRDCTYCPSGWGCGCRCVARSESISVKKNTNKAPSDNRPLTQ